MIAIDTSAIMAMAQKETQALACLAAIDAADQLIMSAVTKIELMIVAGRRGILMDIELMLATLDLQIEPVTEGNLDQVASAYATWGKGIHPAGLNICDCFSYAVAKANDCPLLFVGNDFSKTDVASAL